MKALLVVFASSLIGLNAVFFDYAWATETGKRNTANLVGSAPIRGYATPPLPADQFYAWCYAGPGRCAVRGNGPIAPRSKCHCSTYSGETP
jgi:hypothetical protein